MNCIYCKTGQTRVVETAAMKTKVIRVRKCLECGKRFMTEELGYENRPELNKEMRKIREAMRGGWRGGVE